MKIKEGYLVHEVAGNYVVIKIGQEAMNFNGLITLSESAKMLWDLLKEDASIEDLRKAVQNLSDMHIKLIDIDGLADKIKAIVKQ